METIRLHLHFFCTHKSAKMQKKCGGDCGCIAYMRKFHYREAGQDLQSASESEEDDDGFHKDRGKKRDNEALDPTKTRKVMLPITATAIMYCGLHL